MAIGNHELRAKIVRVDREVAIKRLNEWLDAVEEDGPDQSSGDEMRITFSTGETDSSCEDPELPEVYLSVETVSREGTL